MKTIVLGSNSPRRKELMAELFPDMIVDGNNSFEEKQDDSMPVRDIPSIMSEGKSYGFHRPLTDNEILVTSDTMVLVGETILGKPRSREDAVIMLKSLSGRDHEVLTAVTIRDNRRHETFTDITTVTFKELSDNEINYYIDNYRPFDKAGAYGVQEWIGYIGITSIKGSFYNVMGLPVHKVWEHIQAFL